MATQMQLNILFGRESQGRPDNNKVVSFSAFVFLVFTLTWITEKELERVTENKGDQFRRKKNMELQSSGEKMTNTSGQRGENA